MWVEFFGANKLDDSYLQSFTNLAESVFAVQIEQQLFGDRLPPT